MFRLQKLSVCKDPSNSIVIYFVLFSQLKKKKIKNNQKSKSKRFAAKYLSDFGRPAFLAITIVREGADNNSFELAFDNNSKARELPGLAPATSDADQGRSFNFEAAVPQERSFNF